MNISLKPITQQNYEAICDLEVYEAQEEFVASNVWSLVEAAFNPSYITRGIFLDEQPVGFFMWVPETTDKTSIWRFMLDKAYQAQGIGRQAMLLALAEIQQSLAPKQIEICYDPNNPIAKNFYASFGFIEQGLDQDGDDILAIKEY
ncbi:GNAT family N-acetyltransferase [Pseudomonas sp. F1_0610]|uniref:GNAT family N-acetyltransferase n=1 Tax=Pseudomonas sp. F1_0610 TaxID=3114284 RepID=UPI0039C1097E